MREMHTVAASAKNLDYFFEMLHTQFDWRQARKTKTECQVGEAKSGHHRNYLIKQVNCEESL